MKTQLLLKKHKYTSIASVKKTSFFFIECNAEIAQKGGPSDTYPALQDAILAFGGLAWTLVVARERSCPETDPPPISKTLVMVQSDPTRTPTQLIRIAVR